MSLPGDESRGMLGWLGLDGFARNKAADQIRRIVNQDTRPGDMIHFLSHLYQIRDLTIGHRLL